MSELWPLKVGQLAGNPERVRVLESEEEKKRRRGGERRSTSFRRGFSSGVIPIKIQVPRISILHVVDPAEHSRVSGEPPCIPEDSIILCS
ncbi:hypothetical protein R3W88_027029 [Solanum pinnatisectum]|uniref:Uncharacterized protein n=1 Tax=Solanum pinnatisectum TaxID=50273 RepID=A0AAV9LIB6_9SOLN|nr:hypothetical protein R3W88_027029 [Solanum pinnatisectum]